MTTLSDADIAVCELPPMLRLLVEVAGLQAALMLATRYGGTEICVPTRFDPNGSLARIIGVEAAQKIHERFRGERITIPKGDAALRCARNRVIVQEYRGDVTAGQLALKYGLTERQVRTILNTQTDRNPQLSLRFEP